MSAHRYSYPFTPSSPSSVRRLPRSGMFVCSCAPGALVPCPVDTEPVRRASTDVRLRSRPTLSVWNDAAARGVEERGSAYPSVGLSFPQLARCCLARAARSQRLPCPRMRAFSHRARCGLCAHTSGRLASACSQTVRRTLLISGVPGLQIHCIEWNGRDDARLTALYL